MILKGFREVAFLLSHLLRLSYPFEGLVKGQEGGTLEVIAWFLDPNFLGKPTNWDRYSKSGPVDGLYVGKPSGSWIRFFPAKTLIQGMSICRYLEASVGSR